MATQYRVTAIELNLRSVPAVKPSTRLAVLPQGHIVEKLAEAKPGWWKVRTDLNGVTVEGFVNAKYVEPATAPEPAPVTELRAVHLSRTPPVRRDMASARAFPLSEPGQPNRNGRRAEELAEIVAWLRVERSARYQPISGSTFCNIYAYDYCYLAGVYVPRVWWTGSAIQRLARGETVEVKYGTSGTVKELNANSLCEWFDEFGRRFGWERSLDLDAVQDAANSGAAAVIVARRVDANRSGHITAVVPEGPSRKAARADGQVTVPLQSQAGSRNFRYGTNLGPWWRAAKFRSFGYWIHG